MLQLQGTNKLSLFLLLELLFMARTYLKLLLLKLIINYFYNIKVVGMIIKPHFNLILY